MWLYASNEFVFSIFTFFGGWLERKLGPRLSTLIGSAVVVSGVLLSYFTVQYSFWLLLLTYGVVQGLGSGFVYTGPIACAMRWFPKWKGLASGFVMSGFGLSALLFDEIQTVFINPGNAKPSYAPYATDPGEKYFIDAVVLDRVPYSFLVMGVTYAAILLVASLFIFNPPEPSVQGNSKQCLPEDKGTAVYNISQESQKDLSCDSKLSVGTSSKDPQRPHYESNEKEHIFTQKVEEEESDDEDSDGSSHKSEDERKVLSNPKEIKTLWKHIFHHFKLENKNTHTDLQAGLTPWEVLHKPNFYLLCVMMFLNGIAVTIVASLFKSFGFSFIADDHFLLAVGSVSAIFNALGRIFWGLVADLFSHKVALVSLNGIMAALLLTLYASTVGGEAMYFIWVCGLFFCVGGVQPIFPKATADCFGPKCVGENFGLLCTTQAVANIVAPLCSQLLLAILKWYGLFFLIGSFLVLDFLISLLYQPKCYYKSL